MLSVVQGTYYLLHLCSGVYEKWALWLFQTWASLLVDRRLAMQSMQSTYWSIQTQYFGSSVLYPSDHVSFAIDSRIFKNIYQSSKTPKREEEINLASYMYTWLSYISCSLLHYLYHYLCGLQTSSWPSHWVPSKELDQWFVLKKKRKRKRKRLSFINRLTWVSRFCCLLEKSTNCSPFSCINHAYSNCQYTCSRFSSTSLQNMEQLQQHHGCVQF